MPLLTVRHVHLGLHLQRLQNQIPSRPGFSHVFGPQSDHHPPADILRPTVDGEPDLPEAGFLSPEVMVHARSAFDEIENLEWELELHGQ